MNWVNELEQDERKILNMLAGNLDLPYLIEYRNKVHFLHDVYSRIAESGSLARQLSNALNAK